MPFFRAFIRRLLPCALLLTLAAPGVAADPPVISVLGDSLAAGYGLDVEQGFVPQLQAALARRGRPATVLSAAVSGDTSADGRRRVEWMLRKKPDIVIVELGANDMLRAMPTAQLYDNLDAIIGRIKAGGARVLLAGMMATPDLGDDYAAEFAAVYSRLAEKHQVALFPFFLQDVATVPQFNLPDGLHPNQEGIGIIVDNITPLVEQLIDELP